MSAGIASVEYLQVRPWHSSTQLVACLAESILRIPGESLLATGSYSWSTRIISKILSGDTNVFSIACAGI